MLTKNQIDEARKKAMMNFEKASIVLTEEEKRNIEVADFGLGELDLTGLEIVTYLTTQRN